MIPENEGTGFDEGSGDGQGGGLAVDLSGVSDKGTFPLIPKGTYPAEVDELEYGISQSKGNPMWTWRLKITDGEYTGRTLFYHTTFNEGGLPRVKQALMRIESDDPEYVQGLLTGGAFNPEKVALEGKLIGARCAIRIKHQRYEGEMRASVNAILPPNQADAQGGGDGAGSFGM